MTYPHFPTRLVQRDHLTLNICQEQDPEDEPISDWKLQNGMVCQMQ